MANQTALSPSNHGVDAKVIVAKVNVEAKAVVDAKAIADAKAAVA